jgi:hypothetical protein
VLSWLELLAAVAFVSLLCLRLSPLRHRPQRLRLVPLGSRPWAFVVLGALLVWFVLLFVGVEYDDETGLTFTMVGTVGVLGAFVPLLAIGGVSAAVALTELDESQGLFACATVAAYLAPEAFLLLGSLALGDQFAYFGNGFFWNNPVPWLTIVQAVVAIALAAGTLSLVRGRRA